MVGNKFVSLDTIMDGWISVNETEDPLQFRAWRDYRREALGCQFVPKNFTVPSEFPPQGQLAAEKYAADLIEIRKQIGWVGASATKPLANPKPWK